MDQQLYIRVRGRVLGPYDEQRLRGLVKRGQLSRLHEVSEDGTTWERASSYPDLFVSHNDSVQLVATEHIAPVGLAIGTPVAQPSGGCALDAPTPGMGGVANPPGSDRPWYYNSNGERNGPLDMAAMQRLLAMSQLGPGDLVWSAGLSGWMAVANVPELARWLPKQNEVEDYTQGRGEKRKNETDELPLSLCKAAAGSRPWVVFIAIVAFVYAALSVLGGGYLLILGANVHAAPVVATGLFSIIYGGLAGLGGFLLFSYASRLASLGYGRKAMVMEKAMDSLRHFWIFVGIITIVMLAFLVFVMVWAVAIGGTLPGMLRDL